MVPSGLGFRGVFLHPVTRDMGPGFLRYPNHVLPPDRSDLSVDSCARSQLDLDIDSGDEVVGRQAHLIDPPLCPLNLDRIRGGHENLVRDAVVKVFRSLSPKPQRVRAGGQGFDGEVAPAIRDRMIAGPLFYDYFHSGYPARGLAAVNDWRRQRDEQ